MPSKLDRYLLRNNVGVLAALIAVALAMLMLERLIRITDLIAGADDAFQSGARMVANLLPHYLGMALPGALLIATIITTERLSRSGEMVALLSSGVPLNRIVRPFAALGLMLALAAIVNSGFVQPLSRYNYREIVHELQQSSIVTAFKERKFVQFDDKVVWTSQVDFAGRELGETFIVETGADNSRRFIAGQSGILKEEPGRIWQISLSNAMMGDIPSSIVDQQGNRLNIANINWRLPKPIEGYRDRGDDQRELTLPELFSLSYTSSEGAIDRVAALSGMHDRLSRALLLIVLPFIGVVLGLRLGRTGWAGGVPIGILLLVVVQKLLEYGLEMAQRGAVPPWAGSWPTVGLVVALGFYTFRRRARGHAAFPAFRRSARIAVAGGLGGPDDSAPTAR